MRVQGGGAEMVGNCTMTGNGSSSWWTRVKKKSGAMKYGARKESVY